MSSRAPDDGAGRQTTFQEWLQVFADHEKHQKLRDDEEANGRRSDDRPPTDVEGGTDTDGDTPTRPLRGGEGHKSPLRESAPNPFDAVNAAADVTGGASPLSLGSMFNPFGGGGGAGNGSSTPTAANRTPGGKTNDPMRRRGTVLVNKGDFDRFMGGGAVDGEGGNETGYETAAETDRNGRESGNNGAGGGGEDSSPQLRKRALQANNESLNSATNTSVNTNSLGEHQNTVFRDWLLQTLYTTREMDSKDVQPGEEMTDEWAAARERLRAHHATYDSHDYEEPDSKVRQMYKGYRNMNTLRWVEGSVGKSKSSLTELRRQRRRRKLQLLTLLLGMAIGLAGTFVVYVSFLMNDFKLGQVNDFIVKHADDTWSHRFGGAYAIYLFFNLLFAFGAYFFIWLEPWAAGSGIPEAKCILNGVSMPGVLSMKTLVCKMLGVCCTVCTGLPLGYEGPMIHIGAAIGANISTGTRLRVLNDFRNDRDRRDFAAMGTAAGVTAAFRTPVGGVLFALEESMSFRSTMLTWRSFAASVVTVTTFWLTRYAKHLFSSPMNPVDVYVFGDFSDPQDHQFYILEIMSFGAIGCIGGLLGAAFVHVNQQLREMRVRRIRTPLHKLMEICAASILMSTMAFWLPLMLGRCKPTAALDAVADEGYLEILNTLDCEEGYYNELGSLFINAPDHIVALLYHMSNNAFSWEACFLFGGVYLVMECYAIGLSLSSGIIIPSLICGAALGRGVGVLFGRNARTYALISSGAVLGGIVRMTLSLTVILVEASGFVLFVVPMMVALLMARTVGQSFNEGIYDMLIEVKHIPFLEEEAPEETRVKNLRCNQIMSRPVRCVGPIVRVDGIHALLHSCQHGCFPVVDNEGRLLGTVLRKHLLVLLSKRHFAPPSRADPNLPRTLPVVPWQKLEANYPVYPTLDDVDAALLDRDMLSLMDLTPYLQIGPHAVNEHTSVQRVYTLFRTLGLRHLPVVNYSNEVVGIITRENLLPHHFAKGGIYTSGERATMPI